MSPYLTKPNDKPQWKILVRGTPYYLSKGEIEPCDWSKRRHMIDFQASHWPRALLVVFSTHPVYRGLLKERRFAT